MKNAMTPSTIPPCELTLGILAGGRATRLGGIDKAWLVRDDVPQVLRWQRRFANEVTRILVSANRDLPRYAAAGLEAVADRMDGAAGPLAGLDALFAHCTTPWLLTLPVDLIGVNECLLPTLASGAGTAGAYARDDDGVQPLVALWRVDEARAATRRALAAGDHSIQQLQQQLPMRGVRFAGVRFGNLNTPEDLRAAGFVP
jgi:molybdopterin-guanine dinucleotide biosynthesis protein A